MKQSKKLLSIILAMIMAFSVVSVVGNAALEKDKIIYDNIDDAALTPEQVADWVLDYLDNEVLAGMEDIEIPVLGNLVLNSVDNALSSVYDLLGNGLIGMVAISVSDIKALTSNRSKLNVKRSGGDLNVIYALLDFIGCDDVSTVVSKIVYGIGTSDGISLGGILNSALSGTLKSINSTVQNLQAMVRELLFDALLYGSYAYPDDYETNVNANTNSDVTGNLDTMLNKAVYNLLTKPQEYKRDASGNKVWETETITTTDRVSAASVNLNNNSILQVLDNIIQVAYEDYGVAGLNNEIKRLLMEATGVDFVRVNDAATINMIKAAPGYVDTATATGAELLKVKNYAFDSQMLKIGNNWYLRTNGYEDILDANGNKTYDADGNVLREKVDKFWKAKTGNVNTFYNLVNWDYSFSASDFNFAQMLTDYGSIFGSLNHILYVILGKAVNSDAVNISTLWHDGKNTDLEDANGNIVAENGTSVVNNNILRTAKWVLKSFTKELFGKSSEYVDVNGAATAAFVSKVNACTTIESIVAYIGLPFMNDAMPQLIMPAVFDEGNQIEELGVLAVREFMTDICPTVNYDSFIFTSGSLTAQTGRVFASHTSDEWINILVNMGMDIAYTYLNNITNFNTAIPVQENITNETRWTSMLDAVIIWGVNYVGTGATSVLNGFDPNTIASKEGPFAKLTYILNTLLPLGLVSGEACQNGQLDVRALFDQLKKIVGGLDISNLLTLFGRDNTTNNLLSSTNVVSTVLNLAKRLIDIVLGSGTLTVGTTLEATVANANLKTVIKALLTHLNSRKAALLENALPVVAKFVADIGGEQKIGTPIINLPGTLTLSNGTIGDQTASVLNGSKGVWRHYKDAAGNQYQDEQYTYKITDVKAYNIDGTASSYVTIKSFSTEKINYGLAKTFVYSVANVPAAGAAVRFTVKYIVYGEDGNPMADSKEFAINNVMWLNYTSAKVKICTDTGEKGIYNLRTRVWSDYFINNDPDSVASEVGATEATVRNKDKGVGSQTCGAQAATPLSHGVTFPTTKAANSSALDESKNFEVTDSAALVAFAATPGNFCQWSVDLYANSSKAVTKGVQIKMHFYSGDYLKKLQDLVNDEIGEMRTSAEYKTTGTALAGAVLSTEANADGLVESAFSTTGVDADGETVTAIDCAQAWAAYEAAFAAAIGGAKQLWNDNSVYNHEALYKALYTAAKDVQYLKMTTAELIAAGSGDSNDVAVDALETQLRDIESGLNGKGYTDYLLYRWNRFQDARNAAQNMVAKKDAASFAVAESTYFPYSNISVADLTELVRGNQYSAYILTLLKDYSEADMESRELALANAKTDYASQSALTVAQDANLLTKTYARLLRRTATADNTYIAAEIASAQNVIGTSQGNYTDRSWARYSTALTNAIAARDGEAQTKMFDAKYELQVARNELKTEADEANYDELTSLIAQAEGVLANATLYNNTNADFGKLLAALGMSAIQNADGDNVYLFSNTAKDVNNKSYAADDQNKVDRAADALKVALAAMKFKTTSGGAQGVAPVAPATPETVIENNVVLEEDEQGTPTLTASVATIDANKNASAVKALFTAAAQGASTVEMEISNDNNYANNTDEDLVLTGTNATLTVFTTVSGVKVPVATIKIVVKADLNGDGVIDVLDGLTGELAVNGQATLSGCYFLAGDVNSNDALDTEDFSLIVNKAVA